MAKKEEKVVKLNINLDKLRKYKIPELPDNMQAWKTDEEVSPEYCAMVELCQDLAKYLAVNCNEGPETKENYTKRMILASIILREFINNLALNGWTLYGLLFQELNDVYDHLDGRYNMIELLKDIHKRQKSKPQPLNSGKNQSYVA